MGLPAVAGEARAYLLLGLPAETHHSAVSVVFPVSPAADGRALTQIEVLPSGAASDGGSFNSASGSTAALAAMLNLPR
jgi:hypothetical protein